MRTGTYHEEDWIGKVEILKDVSDDTMEAYHLRVLGDIRPSRMFATRIGDEFTVSWTRGMVGKIWDLIPDSDSPAPAEREET